MDDGGRGTDSIPVAVLIFHGGLWMVVVAVLFIGVTGSIATTPVVACLLGLVTGVIGVTCSVAGGGCAPTVPTTGAGACGINAHFKQTEKQCCEVHGLTYVCFVFSKFYFWFLVCRQLNQYFTISEWIRIAIGWMSPLFSITARSSQ